MLDRSVQFGWQKCKLMVDGNAKFTWRKCKVYLTASWESVTYITRMDIFRKMSIARQENVHGMSWKVSIFVHGNVREAKWKCPWRQIKMFMAANENVHGGKWKCPYGHGHFPYTAKLRYNGSMGTFWKMSMEPNGSSRGGKIKCLWRQMKMFMAANENVNRGSRKCLRPLMETFHICSRKCPWSKMKMSMAAK